MKNYFLPYETFLFTGATYLDYDSNEQFPLAVCDGICIVDDNVCSYGSIIGKVKDEIFNKTIKDQLLYAIDDNIKVLENCANHIYILPIRYLDDKEDEIINKGAEGIFLKLFDDKFHTMRDYFCSIKTIEDLGNSLKSGAESSLIFYKDDDRNLSLTERIANFINDAESSVDLKEKPMSYVFFSAVYPPIAQALHTMMLCAKYKVIPYLRYNVAFHYFCNLIENFPEAETRELIRNKTYTCYLIYKAFDLDSVTPCMFLKFVSIVKDKKVFAEVYKRISNNTVHGGIKQIGDFAHKELMLIINDCKKN